MILLGICVAAGIARWLMFAEYWQENPIATNPVADGKFYWNLAARYASGHVIGETPFLSAPLYPLFVGGVRAIGGGLVALYLFQIALHLLTAIIVAHIARRQFGALAGLMSAGAFVLISDSAIICFRVLTESLQILLVAVSWLVLIVANERRSAIDWLVAGVVLGLLILTSSALILAVPLIVLWVVVAAPKRMDGAKLAAVFLLAFAATLAPSIWHNYRVSGEFIPLSVHGGLTLRHGNAPGANGTYIAARGVAPDKNVQHLDAFRRYQSDTGKQPSWRAVDRYYKALVYEFWLDDPARAAKLAIRKAYWFLTGRVYGDMHGPALEARTGMDGYWRLAPIPPATLIPLTVLAVCASLPHWRRFAPAVIFFTVPWLIVTVFWYSPRYRMPAIPVIAVATGWSLARIFGWRGAGKHDAESATRWKRVLTSRGAIIVAFAAGVGLQFANTAMGFDAPRGVALAFHVRMGRLLKEIGRDDDAVDQYRQAIAYQPTDAPTYGLSAIAKIELGNAQGAVGDLQEAIRLDPAIPEFRAQLGMAFIGMSDFKRAEAEFLAAVQLNPEFTDARFNLAGVFVNQGRLSRAVEQYREILRLDRDRMDAWVFLAITLNRSGNVPEARKVLREGIAQAESIEQIDAAEHMRGLLDRLGS